MALALFILTFILSAFFSGSETAYIAANRLKLHVHRHRTGKDACQDPMRADQRFLAATLVGNNIVNTACASLAVYLFASHIDNTLLVLSTTAFLLLFGEILPKSVAVQLPNAVIRPAVRFINVYYLLFFPFIRLAEAATSLINLLLHHEKKTYHLFSAEDLPLLVREYGAADIVKPHHLQLLGRALKIRDHQLWDVMVPRTEIVGVDWDDPPQTVREVFLNSGYSRLPVFVGEIDNIIGFYYVKDLFNSPPDKLPPLREPLFLPASLHVLEAMRRMKEKKVTAAVAVDEYVGTIGLVTMEDIVEKLVGAINDEFDHPITGVKVMDNRILIVEGKTPLEELRDLYKIDLPEGDYVTFNGFLINHLERVPQKGEKLTVSKYQIEILDATPTKVLQVKITFPAEQGLNQS
ncbi:MAG: hemolysin family protein [candidate division KSB1 bacterium]|nr:hemolysin family protein [candidate division KSB1 bacterium]